MAANAVKSRPDGSAEDEHLGTSTQTGQHESKHSAEYFGDGAGDDEDSDEEEDDTEPILKYTRLTAALTAVYRNGDSTSCFAVSGNKLILGTHNGVLHVLSQTTLESLRVFRAHSASITSISVSPFSNILSPLGREDNPRPTATNQSTSTRSSTQTATNSPKSAQQDKILPTTTSNSIYIATSSIDGHVCVVSLLDPKQFTLRNYSRPVNAVALSPDFKNDRTYISGGLAGNLILTTGGRSGTSSDANTNKAAAAASGWLESIGLGSTTGKDTVLHSGEGGIGAIEWSLSGKYVAWSNEEGIKIMRSNLHLDSALTDSAWKRIAYIERPNRRSWLNMANVWKARIEWADEKCVESEEHEREIINGSPVQRAEADNFSLRREDGSTKGSPKAKKRRKETLFVGWGDTIWHIEVESSSSASTGIGTAEIIRIVRFPDEVISGLSLYTPSLLLVLAYRARHENSDESAPAKDATPKKGISRRANGMPPSLRLIDLNAPDEGPIEDTELTISRYETFSSADYHLSTIFTPTPGDRKHLQRRITESAGGSIWDASLNASRLFSSSASIRSGSSSGERSSFGPSQNNIAEAPGQARAKEPIKAITNPGLKVFVCSPFDCILAIRRDPSDRFTWLLEQERYQEAWELIDKHPDVVAETITQSDSRPSTPAAKGDQTLSDFFSDDTASQGLGPAEKIFANVEKEKQRVADLWIQQLAAAGDWKTAGAIAEKTLKSPSRWEHWIWAFAQAEKFDEITPYIPTQQLKPALPSTVYEVVLGHYISQDRVTFGQLMDRWSYDLFDVSSINSAINAKLESGDVREDTVEGGVVARDWHILLNVQAKLYLHDGRPADALHCYLQTKNSDAVFQLVRQYKLLSAISSDIWRFSQLRIPQQTPEDLDELDRLSSEPVLILASAAIREIISPRTTLSHLESHLPESRPFIFFYFRALWNGDSAPLDAETSTVLSQQDAAQQQRRRRFSTAKHANVEAWTTKSLIEPYGNFITTLFAEFDHSLLSEFLRDPSRMYDFDHACTVCERHGYTMDLVYLYSEMGQHKRALYLIINDMQDVSAAIAFAKEVNEPSLWRDLLEYSMDKPPFVLGLLEDVGTAIDPVTLVRKIPDGLEVPGLKGGLTKLVRESEAMWSISESAAKVLRHEVGGELETLNKGRMKGVAFDIPNAFSPHITPPEIESKGKANAVVDERPPSSSGAPSTSTSPHPKPKSANTAKPQDQKGHCAICHTPYIPTASIPQTDPSEGTQDETEHLIGFPCGHIYHLSCLLDAITDDSNKAAIAELQRRLAAPARPAETDDDDFVTDHALAGIGPRSVRRKTVHAQMIKRTLGEGRGCIVCGRARVKDVVERRSSGVATS